VVDVEAVAEAASPYLWAAAGAYGAAVVQRLNEQASAATADAATGLARRVWHRLSGRLQGADVSTALAQLGTRPDDAELRDAVRAELRAAMNRDRELARDLAAILTEAGVGKYTVTVTGGQGVQVGDNSTMTLNINPTDR
jgi:hypothetical protein